VIIILFCNYPMCDSPLLPALLLLPLLSCRLSLCAEEEHVGGKHVRVNGYHFLKTLGKGAYGEVRLATKDLVEDDFSQHTR
jgi:hypothetical protein